MTSSYICSSCRTYITKQNGAQPGCPSCGHGWVSAPKIEPWPEVSPWTIPYEPYVPYVPTPTYPGTWPHSPWYKLEWTITSDGTTNTLKYDPELTTISTTGFKYGIEENEPS